ncbi:energy transducer TonB [Pedobacter sp. SD-b]|uniref:Energy transducer TonB n=1 Tax=Pedobacter segetis TaxID=2793069 RepID=A0ABS1BJI2_9SPHI|nr:energy transducer TonB [Pedobacter segetis]MBK0383047.1 energy transducer TonB [Pedobacter segetis]
MLFSKINVNKVEWLNLIFENRNQSYGAYVLRKESGNYLMKALIVAMALLLGFFLLSAFKAKPNVVKSNQPISALITPEIITEVELIKDPIKKQEPIQKAETKQTQNIEDVKTINYSGNIKPVDQPKIDLQLPTETDLKNSIISTVTKVGKNAEEGTNGGAENGKNNYGTTEESGNSETYDANLVERMPEFPGGMAAWAKFLNKNLNYPSMAKDANVTGRVTVSFVVEKNGAITDIKILRGIGAGCDEEAIRVIRKSPLWSAGIQNGRPVRVSYVMPIVFRLD